MTSDKRSLLRQSSQAAVEFRDELGLDMLSPADPYAAAEARNVKVSFLDVSMEGFYLKGTPPRILLSALRPVVRRAFTCAHELGHLWYGHGSTIDELKEDERPDSGKPEEILANGFASFFLMPTVGLRNAFAKRKWSISAPTPLQLFIVACEFGVGYTTLLNHLCYMLHEITQSRKAELAKWTPQRIRRQVLEAEFESLLIVDDSSQAASYDIERGSAILLPLGANAEGIALEHVGTIPDFQLFRAARRGKSSIEGTALACEVRVMPKPYVGPAANRFLEDPDEEE